MENEKRAYKTRRNADKNTETKSQSVTVTAQYGLNVRKSAATTANVVKILPHGAQAVVTETKGDWGFIGNGWIMLRYTDYSALK